MRLEPILMSESALIIENAADRDAVLSRLAEAAAKLVPGYSAQTILTAFEDREAQTPTATPEGVAFPHAMLKNVDRTTLLIARLKPAVSFGGQDLPASDLVFCMVGSAEKPWVHVRLLARLARVARAPGALERLRGADTAEDLFARLIEEDRAHA